ncbi:hypothetical protein EK21DRAFT_89971 [Setomelanomma holmii]|uniref:Uncharacterized protein n=1 Tax=Setomelanomma holmii TaxID=210430 RepID=A0A9P4H6S1_9PLEO|nr:hypothetical protein EK21DRAFT_89971 [Setomelanomma holmii]
MDHDKDSNDFALHRKETIEGLRLQLTREQQAKEYATAQAVKLSAENDMLQQRVTSLEKAKSEQTETLQRTQTKNRKLHEYFTHDQGTIKVSSCVLKPLAKQLREIQWMSPINQLL